MVPGGSDWVEAPQPSPCGPGGPVKLWIPIPRIRGSHGSLILFSSPGVPGAGSASSRTVHLLDNNLARSPRGPSQKGTDRRPSKKLKCEKKSRAKVDVPQGAGRESAGPGLLSRRASSEGESADLEMMLQNHAKRMPETDGETARDRTDLGVEASALGPESSFPQTDGGALLQTHFRALEDEEEEEEESHGAGGSDDSEMEPEEPDEPVVEVDNSPFLNEDSNQPLPVDRFFGSVAFMQDLPAAPLTRAIASRREFRKAHFIAKEDDEDDDDEEEEEEVI